MSNAVEHAPAYTAQTVPKQAKTDSDLEAHPVRRKSSPSTETYDEKAVEAVRVAEDNAEAAQGHEERHTFYMKYRPFILGALALLILGWWISSIVLKATRHRWSVAPRPFRGRPSD